MPRFARTAALTLLACTAALSTGCANNNAIMEEDLIALQNENEELRARETQLQDALRDAEGRSNSVESERERLMSENADLRSQLAAAAAQPAARSNDTGFEGISGATTSRRGSDIVVDVAGDVLFASGSVTLKDSAKQTLDSIARVINNTYAGQTIRIAGHTDSDPIRKSKWGTNERLSAERAHAVEQYLASKGVDKGRMYIAGYGPDVPRGTKAQSRRVEIIVLDR